MSNKKLRDKATIAGILVYIPSQVRLVQYGDKQEIVENQTTFPGPDTHSLVSASLSVYPGLY